MGLWDEPNQPTPKRSEPLSQPLNPYSTPSSPPSPPSKSQFAAAPMATAMISAVCWVPKGACNPLPVEVDPPTLEEIQEAKQALASTGDAAADDEDPEVEDNDEDGDMEVEFPSSAATSAAEEVSHARAAAAALGTVHDIADGLRELNMDHYDDEDDDAVELFGKGIGDSYYASNDMDPYLKKKKDESDEDEDDDDDEKADMTIKPTDSVIVCARNEDEVNALEVFIVEELEDGDLNMFPHHSIMLSDFPLCTAWLDCDLRNGADKGNFIAVGSMDTAIEIWDLDLLEEVQPFMVLGGLSKKKRKGKKTSVKYKKGSHRSSVLGLAWNKEVRNVLASASADKSVKVWDMAAKKCVVTIEHHTDKVQTVAWSRHSPEILLSGSFDRSVVMTDVRSSEHPSNRWSVTADVESIAWDPHNEHSFVVSLDDGTVQGFDIRVVATNSSSGSKPSFTLHAHDKAVSSISYNPSAANFLATGSTDKMVKLWDLSNNKPSCVASKNPKAGAVFSVSFSEENPFLLAIGGSKGRLELWDTLSDPGVVRSFGKFSNRQTEPMSSA